MSDPNVTERLSALLAELPCNKEPRSLLLSPARERLVRAVEALRDDALGWLETVESEYFEKRGERKRAEATFNAVLQVLVGVETPDLSDLG